MGLIDIASNNSTWRGLDYYKENRVINYSKVNDNQYEGVVWIGYNKLDKKDKDMLK